MSVFEEIIGIFTDIKNIFSILHIAFSFRKQCCRFVCIKDLESLCEQLSGNSECCIIIHCFQCICHCHWYKKLKRVLWLEHHSFIKNTVITANTFVTEIN